MEEKSIQVGDFVKAYHKGIHQITKIEPLKSHGVDHGFLATYVKVFNDNMTKAAKRENSSNLGYCTKVDVHELREELDEITKKYKSVIHFMNCLDLEDIPEYGDHMTFEHFEDCVKAGGFIDYDGYGNYATADKMTASEIRPSDFYDDNVDRTFSHIVWFNK